LRPTTTTSWASLVLFKSPPGMTCALRPCSCASSLHTWATCRGTCFLSARTFIHQPQHWVAAYLHACWQRQWQSTPDEVVPECLPLAQDAGVFAEACATWLIAVWTTRQDSFENRSSTWCGTGLRANESACPFAAVDSAGVSVVLILSTLPAHTPSDPACTHTLLNPPQEAVLKV